jgi:hypothetical protein
MIQWKPSALQKADGLEEKIIKCLDQVKPGQ